MESKKQKKSRLFTNDQMIELEGYLGHKPTEQLISELAKKFKVSDNQIKNWFRNRQAKVRQQNKVPVKRNLLKYEGMGFDELLSENVDGSNSKKLSNYYEKPLRGKIKKTKSNTLQPLKCFKKIESYCHSNKNGSMENNCSYDNFQLNKQNNLVVDNISKVPLQNNSNNTNYSDNIQFNKQNNLLVANISMVPLQNNSNYNNSYNINYNNYNFQSNYQNNLDGFNYPPCGSSQQREHHFYNNLGSNYYPDMKTYDQQYIQYNNPHSNFKNYFPTQQHPLQDNYIPSEVQENVICYMKDDTEVSLTVL
ncbi:putative uncharacterized protein DDB_G0282499 [Aethina tumida]|uniref:putative uncharacterized protein DDB_G0282499 n=1 Tax=Aethina tumida TaxID=116153 RepID=UPI002148E2F3|nr:putative uncharacterized protein DDB_G0282499 [Aethina tumida]